MDIRLLLESGELCTEVKDGMVWYSKGWITHNVKIQVKEYDKWVDVPVVEIGEDKVLKKIK